LYREHYHLKRICKFACNYSCKYPWTIPFWSAWFFLLYFQDNHCHEFCIVPFEMYWTFHILEGKFSNSFLYFLLIYILFHFKKIIWICKRKEKINQAGLYVGEGLKKRPFKLFDSFPWPISLGLKFQIWKGLFSDPSPIPLILHHHLARYSKMQLEEEKWWTWFWIIVDKNIQCAQKSGTKIANSLLQSSEYLRILKWLQLVILWFRIVNELGTSGYTQLTMVWNMGLVSLSRLDKYVTFPCAQYVLVCSVLISHDDKMFWTVRSHVCTFPHSPHCASS
jgi:hypothetical protein